MFVTDIKKGINRAIGRWLRDRIPASRSVLLDNKKLFIFPTAAGAGWLLLVLLTWLAATNYENNLVFAFACLLSSLFVVAILATFANISGITVKYVRSTPVFAGEEAIVEIVLLQQQNQSRESIRCGFARADSVLTGLAAVEEQRVHLAVQTTRRGWLNPGRLVIETTYPLGLLRAWSKLDLAVECLVYPRPVKGTPLTVNTSGRGDGPLLSNEGADDFVGLKDYRVGESLRRIAWKQYAREQGLMAKHYADPVDEELWLDWDAFDGFDREARLSRLCAWSLELARTPNSYGLRLPGCEISPNRGEAHQQAVLRALALFEIGPQVGKAET